MDENYFEVDQQSHRFVYKTLPLLVLSLGLFFGGIILLILRIPGWSIFLGLPSIQIGIVFLIFSFDGIAKREVGPSSCKLVDCSICGKPMIISGNVKKRICEQCLQTMSKTLKKMKGKR
ncbi:hypothetical protein A3J78_01790 [Candidatus Beckwithbacteria bacterium RBG_13_35_6]|uniref:Uncharacterized protein n=1 Tax=Candidatus Beckwithbacteria bacterium RBG_13_35_6 TaxID=1797456 RepID=A0A1F5DF33_9BACT|nr:MAG: hypothetical protein A3J78_01790 [Candidatus Beckwithbacteria bacterium RBG_13_35_6]